MSALAVSASSVAFAFSLILSLLPSAFAPFSAFLILVLCEAPAQDFFSPPVSAHTGSGAPSHR